MTKFVQVSVIYRQVVALIVYSAKLSDYHIMSYTHYYTTTIHRITEL